MPGIEKETTVVFWSDKTLRGKGQSLVQPYREERVQHGAYELSVGSEAYITTEGKKSKVTPDTPVKIPPGQFGLLITREVVVVPIKAIAFISIRAGTKFRGLVNVSGFHVDPGYNDRLMFSVYNAGSQDIILDYDQPVFLIWFADLDEDTEKPYPPRTGEPRGISADDIMKIQGEVASPAELKKEIESLKTELKEEFHITEQSRLYNRGLLTVILSLVVTLIASILGWIIIKPTFDKTSPTPLPASQTAPTTEVAPGPSNGHEKQPDLLKSKSGNKGV
ncbi:MAG TPA: hypothetical protein VE988_30150 [Gemmataceae bacterium]|nr:hypothetical protein [Gemmataceae bacterium]